MSTRRLAVVLLAAGALAFAVMAVLSLAAPGIDLAVSRHFMRAGGFSLAASPMAEAARTLFRASTHLFPAGITLAALLAGAGVLRPRLRLRETAFVLAVYALGPGLLVNLGLKTHWGRARPRDIAEFGGTAHFTPPLLPADQCARDCSFVSAETAGLAFLAFAVLLTAWPRLPSRAARLAAAAALAGWAAAGAGLRIAVGAHFFSDVVFAAALMAMLVPGLWLALGLGRGPLTPAAA